MVGTPAGISSVVGMVKLSYVHASWTAVADELAIIPVAEAMRLVTRLGVVGAGNKRTSKRPCDTGAGLLPPPRLLRPWSTVKVFVRKGACKQDAARPAKVFDDLVVCGSRGCIAHDEDRKKTRVPTAEISNHGRAPAVNHSCINDHCNSKSIVEAVQIQSRTEFARLQAV